ncbi:MAG: HD domain-containing protein [Epsilonproteobacteria bacterium]|nr:HD domain-containing protein [Campylobacterota bacterium]
MKNCLKIIAVSFFVFVNLQAKIENTAYVVDKIFSVLTIGAEQDYIGEDVSQLEHALQAAYLAVQAGGTQEQIIAALLHDIGHLCADQACEKMGIFGTAGHEELGAEYLFEHGFSDTVCALVKGHVQAKRYLAFKDEAFRGKLSYASQQTLVAQGGPMTQGEAHDFEQDPLFEQKLQIREWDDQAKVVDCVVPELEYYRDMLIDHVQQVLR